MGIEILFCNLFRYTAKYTAKYSAKSSKKEIKNIKLSYPTINSPKIIPKFKNICSYENFIKMDASWTL